MAVRDESQEPREQYAQESGWSDRAERNAPAQGEPGNSPSPDEQAAPSAEQEPASSEEATPQQATEGEPAKPEGEAVYKEKTAQRIQELLKEREEAQRQRDEALRLAQEAIQRSVPQPSAQPQADPWEPLVKHQDPQTAQFWGQMQQLVRHERSLAKQEAVQELQPVIQAGLEKLAQIDLREFRKDNPDIKSGSDEENQIVSYMNGKVDGVRHPLESAKRNVLFDRLKSEVESYKQKKASVPQKRAAAMSESSSGIPAESGLPPKRGDWRETASEILDKGGTMRDVATVLFGGKR